MSEDSRMSQRSSPYFEHHKEDLQTTVPVTLDMSRVDLKNQVDDGELKAETADKIIDKENKLLRALSESALQLVKKNEIIENQMIDPLTGAFTRRKYEEDAKDLFRRGEKGTTELLIDLLGVNRANDDEEYGGHDLGDEYIKRVAGRIIAEGRTLDRVYRIGGDEFVVLIPAVTPSEEKTYRKTLEGIEQRYTDAGNDEARLFMEDRQLPERMRLGVSVGGYIQESEQLVDPLEAKAQAGKHMMDNKRAYYASLPEDERKSLKKS